MIVLRVECDREGCESHVAIDLTHPAVWGGFGGFMGASGRGVTVDGVIELPEGWTATGVLNVSVQTPFTVTCGAHGAAS